MEQVIIYKYKHKNSNLVLKEEFTDATAEQLIDTFIEFVELVYHKSAVSDALSNLLKQRFEDYAI